MKTFNGPLSLAGSIIDYENGDLDEDQTLDLFQSLVNTGLAWSLQGSYGRTALGLIEDGMITRPAVRVP